MRIHIDAERERKELNKLVTKAKFSSLTEQDPCKIGPPTF